MLKIVICHAKNAFQYKEIKNALNAYLVEVNYKINNY